MPEQKREKTPETTLRKKAEKILRSSPKTTTDASSADIQSISEDLNIHRIELGIQSEEILRINEELKQARDEYVSLFDFAPVGYIIIDSKNLITKANLTACQLLGKEREALLDHRFTVFIDPQFLDVYYKHRKSVLKTGDRQTCGVTMRKADGSIFYARLDSVKYGSDQLRITIVDITERKQAAEALKQRTADLEVAIRELEGYGFSISHTLQAPLRHVVGFSQAVLEDYGDKLDATGKDYLKRIRKAGQTMSQYLDDLLKLSAAATAELTHDKVNLSEIVLSAAARFQDTHRERRLDMVIQPGITVSGDRQLLQTAIENLLNNAFKFTAGVAPARIEFGMKCNEGENTYFIKDNGVGFDMAYAERLFDPFVRLHRTGQFPGTGIGLPIVQRIIHRHGGQVWAEGEPGKGATFYFTLP